MKSIYLVLVSLLLVAGCGDNPPSRASAPESPRLPEATASARPQPQPSATRFVTAPSATAVPAGVKCDFSGTITPVIKGNVSFTANERIYHVPGGAFYDATVVNPANGERLFCTESEALAAGWRKSAR